MTGLLTAADLLTRLRTGGGCYEPTAVAVDWRSCFDDRPVLETGFNPDWDEADREALQGNALHHESTTFPDLPPWRDSYVIRPAVTS